MATSPAQEGVSTKVEPRALPLVFTHSHKMYDEGVRCILNNDPFTEFLNEDFDSYVLNPWSWSGRAVDSETVTLALLVPVALLTLVTNIIVVLTFVKHNMLSAINIILIAIAVSDTFTVLVPAAAIVYLFFDDNVSTFIPYDYCRSWGYLTKYLPTITHNASIWLTVVLALDRYVAVKHPFLMRRVCVPRKSVVVIIGIYIGAILGHLCRFIDTDYMPVNIVSIYNRNASALTGNEYGRLYANMTKLQASLCTSKKAFLTCRAVYSPLFRDFKSYEFFYYWFVILFVKFIPCICLIILDTLMIRTLWEAVDRRRHLSPTIPRAHVMHQKNKSRENRRITMIVIIVIVIVVIVELPIGMTLMFWTLETIHGSEFISERTLSTLSRTANLVVYLSYPVIFILYCSVSAKFRRTFCRCGKCCKKEHIEVNQLN